MRLYAHRGSPGPSSVENTVRAVRTALEDGADGVEVDLRLSSDGVLVVCHDADLRRLTGERMPVSTTPWAALRSACARQDVALARAEDVLAAAADRHVVLELKHPPPGCVPATAHALQTLLASPVGSAPAGVTVSSFSPDLVAAVRPVRASASGVRTALLGRLVDPPTALVRRALEAGHDEVHPHVAALLAEPAAVALAHAVGMTVVAWTANRGRVLRRLASLGVDAAITDVPVSARTALGSRWAAAA